MAGGRVEALGDRGFAPSDRQLPPRGSAELPRPFAASMRFADTLPDLGHNPRVAFMLGCGPLVHLGCTLGGLRSANCGAGSAFAGDTHASHCLGVATFVWQLHGHTMTSGSGHVNRV